MEGSPTYFRKPALLRAWLMRYHASASELSIGFYKKDTGKPGVSYVEALDEALCFGWIDGVRHRVDDESFKVRFTPRKPKSYWSSVNLAKMKALIAAGRVAPSGLAAYERRDTSTKRAYSFENKPASLPGTLTKILRANKAAWAWFTQSPPGYQRTTIYWILSAKQDATRLRRLAQLVEYSAQERKIPAVG